MVCAGAAASSAADKAAAAQAAAAVIVADVERRLQASGQPGPEGGVKALALPPQASCFLLSRYDQIHPDTSLTQTAHHVQQHSCSFPPICPQCAMPPL